MDIKENLNKFFNKKELNSHHLFKLVEQVMEQLPIEVLEEEDKRFSYTIDIPKLVPSEAWGDPGSQSRQEIERVFASVTGGQNIAARIASINKFLTPENAKRKTSPRVILNMMMITEALQATLNDYNESAAGFVFEGFMAALTGGKQIAGKIAGTLPIEDFVAFSEFGSNIPVSLKLLSPTTPIKGSYTNIVDFLFYRNVPSIKYLVAYKLVSGEKVEKLKIFAFDVTRENFVDFIYWSGTGWELLRGPAQKDLVEAINVYNQNPNKENLIPLAQLLVRTSGYTKKGFLHSVAKTGERAPVPSPEDEEEKKAKTQAAREKGYSRIGKYMQEEDSVLNELRQKQLLGTSDLSLNEAFHFVEKQTLLTEASDSQWKVSWPQLESLSEKINLESYGELDLSQSNIDQLIEIYSKVLEGGITALLEATKALTDNIGTYYSARNRSKAQAAGQEGVSRAEDVKDALEKDPRYAEEK